MPELPEVETMRRGVMPVIGSRIDAAERPPCKCRPILFRPRIDAFDRRVRGKSIADIGRRGQTRDDHFGRRPSHCDRTTHDRIGFAGRSAGARAFETQVASFGRSKRAAFVLDRRGLGTVRLLRPTEIENVVDAKLGVDALEISVNQLRDALGQSRREIKVALLDQAAVAGIGNLYAAEILYVAGVDPRTRCDKLSLPQWTRIQAGIRHVLDEAILHEGSTLSDGTYRNALNESGGYQNYHRVYDRADSPCRRCGEGVIRRIVQSQRSTFFCPKCQRKTGLHASITDN